MPRTYRAASFFATVDRITAYCWAADFSCARKRIASGSDGPVSCDLVIFLPRFPYCPTIRMGQDSFDGKNDRATEPGRGAGARAMLDVGAIESGHTLVGFP